MRLSTIHLKSVEWIAFSMGCLRLRVGRRRAGFAFGTRSLGRKGMHLAPQFVIIDAPSLNVAADAATLGQMADGVLLVVPPGVVDSVNASVARELLEKSGQNVLGQVVNGVIPKNEPHSYYYFSEQYYSQESDSIDKSARTVQ